MIGGYKDLLPLVEDKIVGGYKDLLPQVEARIEAPVGQEVAHGECKDVIDVVQRIIWQILVL